MIPGLGGGISASDSTSVSFDPFNNQSKSAANNIFVKSSQPMSLSNILPVVLIVGVVLLAIKFLK